MMRGDMRLAFWLLWSLLAGVLALGYLLFAFENFRFGGLAVLEGVFAALAGLALLASIIIFRHSPMKAASAVLAGSLSLTAYFALASLLVEPGSSCCSHWSFPSRRRSSSCLPGSLVRGSSRRSQFELCRLLYTPSEKPIFLRTSVNRPSSDAPGFSG